jgi:single-strand DNA-binding protein
MAGSVNRVILVGNVGKDPEVRSFANGGKVCNLTLATSESWTDKASGERKERTEWHRVAIMNDSIVGVAERFVKKGSKIYVEGQLQTRKWTDQQGAEKYSTEIVIGRFNGSLVLLDGKRDDGGERPAQASRPAATQTHQTRDSRGDMRTTPNGPDLDDDIPF